MRQGHTQASALALVDVGAQVDRPAIETAIRRILVAIGEDPEREGLVDTPRRVADMYAAIFGRTSCVLTDFENPQYDQMITLRDIPIFSFCEHHILPFVGRCHIGYIPDRRVIGLSKLVRIARYHAASLQLQERLTQQIADDLMERLHPKGVGVIIEAEHACISLRGVQTPGTLTATNALRGVFLSKAEARQEFFDSVRCRGRQ
jgi:GTP cyclohydrolase I